MTRYLFDFRDGDSFLKDEKGLEYPRIEVVKKEAAAGLAEYAKDVTPGSDRREIAVEVRTLAGPVLTTKMVFEVQVLMP